MKRSDNRVWASLALLSIIAPVGLLATFRLTGVLKEPSKPEIITVETITWNMSRPTKIVTIDERVENLYSDNTVSMSLGVRVAEYWETMLGWFPSDGDDDVLYLSVSSIANLSKGFIHSVAIRFTDVDSFAVLYIDQDAPSRKLNNLQFQQASWSSSYRTGAYLATTGVSEPTDVSLSINVYWVFSDQNDADHWMTTRLEITYFNGTAFMKVISPIRIGVLVH